MLSFRANQRGVMRRTLSTFGVLIFSFLCASTCTIAARWQSKAAGTGRAATLNNRGLELYKQGKLDEAIAMSDRVVILSAGPGSRLVGEFRIDLERPRDVAEIRATPRFVELHQAIWDVLRDQVLAGYQQQLAKAV